jgi:DNA-binding NarL/FixJ family response regulator
MVRVLIAEDEPLLAVALKAQLRARGFQVVGIAKDGQEAVVLCRELNPDAVLMDIRMPVMDGIEATRRIMEACPARVVILSAWAEREALAQAEEAVARAYLMKLASIDEVVRALEIAPQQCD